MYEHGLAKRINLIQVLLCMYPTYMNGSKAPKKEHRATVECEMVKSEIRTKTEYETSREFVFP